MSIYIPAHGTVPHRAIIFLKNLPAGSVLSTEALSRAAGTTNLGTLLSAARLKGAVFADKLPGRGLTLYWGLTKIDEDSKVMDHRVNAGAIASAAMFGQSGEAEPAIGSTALQSVWGAAPPVAAARTATEPLPLPLPPLKPAQAPAPRVTPGITTELRPDPEAARPLDNVPEKAVRTHKGEFELVIADDPYTRATPSRYTPIFERMTAGQCIPCPPEAVDKVKSALDTFIKAKGWSKTHCTRIVRQYHTDKKGRVWLLTKAQAGAAA